MNAHDSLAEWTEQYVRNKDLLTKSIVNIVREDGGWTFAVIKKDCTQHYLVMPHFAPEDFLKRMKPDINGVLVVLNTKHNLSHVIEHWQALTQFPKLAIIFANPDASGDKRWMVSPHTHDKITERKALRRGLESLAMTVAEVAHGSET
ncbi:hypothetical protein HY492_04175 [Candidatus Woesearchaeota archaeon]|nr:hypothetical protein [Candidatus Woesearchaeota archaeon]